MLALLFTATVCVCACVYARACIYINMRDVIYFIIYTYILYIYIFLKTGVLDEPPKLMVYYIKFFISGFPDLRREKEKMLINSCFSVA